jgi:multiple sugar transport system ATP-binding protein
VSGVVLKKISKKFGDVYAVKQIDLTIRDKEFVVLVGPSGCGKSTTLMMIAGLEDVIEGEVFIDGKQVNDVEPKDRDIAMVFQNYALYPHMNVYKNMAFGLKLKKIPKAEIHSRVTGAARILEIEDLLHRKPKELSGGQRQRVAMGRAIVRQPKVFLFDEPLSNLDAKLRVQMRSEISKLHKRLQTTVIYVTHDQVEAMTLAERIVVMKDGQILDQGEPLDVYNNPRNIFVAGFIGSPAMNFFPVAVEREGSQIVLKNSSFRLTVPEKLQNKYKKITGSPAILGLRPHVIQDASLTKCQPGWDRLTAKAEVIEPMGNEVVLLLSIGDIQFRAIVDPQTKAKANEDIELLFNMNKMHLFDEKTEEVIG